MSAFSHLETASIRLLREAYSAFTGLVMLWSMGKDSTVLLYLARKAFLGRVPFPVLHIDTGFKIPEILEWRTTVSQELGLDLRVVMNEEAIRKKETFPDSGLSRTECCYRLKTLGLRGALDGTLKQKRLNLVTGFLEDAPPILWDAVIVGLRADEEGSRSKERYISVRGVNSRWDVAAQPAEFWNQYQRKIPEGGHVRIHPLLDWTEEELWGYIVENDILVSPLYFDGGNGLRYRSLGCSPCTGPISSSAKDASEVLEELRNGPLKSVPERSGRAQDTETGGLETLRKDGYM